jgi:methionyl-tRNA formyltransferase
MQMDEGLDTGAILLTEKVPIGDGMTAGELHDILAQVGAELLPRGLAALARGVLVATPQPELGITYAAKIDKAEARIDWTRPASELDRRIRALSPFPGAWFEAPTDGRPTRIKVLRARPEAASGAPGTLLDDGLTVACGQGALTLTEVQRESRGRMTAEELIRGLKIPPGTRLG